MDKNNNCLTYKRRKFLAMFAGATISISIISIENINIVKAKEFPGGAREPLIKATIEFLSPVGLFLGVGFLFINYQHHLRSASLKQGKSAVSLQCFIKNTYSTNINISFTISVVNNYNSNVMTPILVNSTIQPSTIWEEKYSFSAEGYNSLSLCIKSLNYKSQCFKIPTS